MEDNDLQEIIDLSDPGRIFIGNDIDAELWPDAQYIYDLWKGKRKGRIAPQRKDFSPVEMKQCLPLIALHDIFHDPLRQKVRLLGTEIVRSTGMEVTGQFLDDLPNTGPVQTRVKWVVNHCKPLLVTGLPLIWSAYDYKHYDVLILPLVDDDNKVVMILYFNRYY